MKDQDLFNMWKQESEQEKRLFEQHQGEYLRIAQKRSNDVFSRIRKNIVLEAIFSVFVAAVFPFIFWEDPLYFWLLLTLMLISLGVAIKIYWSYLRDIKQLNETNVVESLSKKLAILTRYVSQLNFYVLVFAPLGFAVGYTFALRQQEVDLTRVLVLLAFSLPFLGLIIWVCKKYIQVLYGRHLKRIEAIYQSLLEH